MLKEMERLKNIFTGADFDEKTRATFLDSISTFEK
jgi:hypothetical protein